MSLANESAAPAPLPAPLRQPYWQRKPFWVVAGTLGCLAFLGAQTVYRHHQAATVLETALQERDREDPGWRLRDLEAARQLVPDDANSALRVRKAADLLPRDWWPPESRGLLTNLRPDEPARAAAVDAVRKFLEKHRPAMVEARDLADLPTGRHSYTLSRKVYGSPLPHADQAETAAILLGYDAFIRTEDGDLRGALRSCRAALNAGRSLGDEPFAASQWVRFDCSWLVYRAVQRLLTRGELAEDDLLPLQRLVDDEERHPALLLIMRGERAKMNELLEAVEAEDVPLDELKRMVPPVRAHGEFMPLRSVDAVRLEHPKVLATLSEAVEIAKLPPHERPSRIDAWEASIGDDASHSMIYSLLPDLGYQHGICRRADARLRCLVAALAVERYRLRHNRWPATLNDLTPDLLPHVPLDPGDGEPLRFRCYPDRVVIYSLLTNRVPEGLGAVAFNPDGPSAAGSGISVHLFDPAKRRVFAFEP